MKPLLKQYGPALASGAALALCFPTWHLYPLAWVALVPLLLRTRVLSAKACFGQFWIAGAAFYLVLLQWLMTNLYWAGGWAFWGYVLLSLFMALYWGILGLAWAKLRMLPGWTLPISFAALWAAMEFLQSTLFTGFGWGALGYSQGKDLPLLQWAALGGAPLVSAILVLFNALVAQTITERKNRVVRTAAAGAVLLLSHGVGMLLLGKPEYGPKPFTAGIVQTNFSLEMKWDWEYTEEMVRNAAEKSRWLAQHEKVDLLVWPESLIMDSIDHGGIGAQLTDLTSQIGCALFTGATRVDDPTGGFFNSSYLVDEKGQIAAHYDKVHLAPFGEYVPLSKYLPFIQKIVPAIGEIQAGNEAKVLEAGGRRFGPLICFEVLFAPMSERLRAMGADLLVVITNLGWFGASSAIPQELEIARMRAVETRLPLVHCANTGISGVFDPWGRFILIDNAFDAKGNVVSYRGHITPNQTIRERLFGAIRVPLPAKRLLPHGPQMFPWLALALSVAILVWAYAKGDRPLGAPASLPARKKENTGT